MIISYNTMELLSQVIYSLFCRLDGSPIHVLVVDNASTDGSRELLLELANAGLCEVILNDEQRYHGPGINQAMEHLAIRQSAVAPDDRVKYVWILDSDCVVIRQDALSNAMQSLESAHAAICGQAIYDDWHQGDMMGLHSLLIDPALVRQPEIMPFQEHGSPSEALQHSVRKAGLPTVDFPFTRDGYVVHIGRGTLRSIVEQADSANQYFEWATTHNDPHFMLEADGRQLYEEFLVEFEAKVGPLTTADDR